MTQQETALTVIDEESGGALQIVGMVDPTIAGRLAVGLMEFHPKAKAAGPAVMLAVANLAMATGANPLPGANGIHLFEQKKKDEKTDVWSVTFTPMLGKGFWEGELQINGGIVWFFRPRPMTEEEMKEWKVTAVLSAYICSGCTGNAFKQFRQNTGATYAEAMAELWRICHIGVGTVHAARGQYGKEETEKQGRPHGWTAQKRAEKDLFSKICPIGNTDGRRHYNRAGEFAGGTDWEVSDFVKPTRPAIAAHSQKTVAQLNGDLFGDDNNKVSPTDDIHEGDYSEAETVTTPPSAPAVVTVKPPTDWKAEALTAVDYDTLAYRLYQLHKQAGIFKDAGELQKHLVKLCGEAFEVDHVALKVDAMGRYINSRADGVVTADAGAAAKQWYADQVRAALWDDMPSASDKAGDGGTAVAVGLFPDAVASDTTYTED